MSRSPSGRLKRPEGLFANAMKRNRYLLSFVLLCLGLLPAISATGAILPREKIQNGGYILYRNGRVIEQHRSGELFIPASTIKLLTAYAALKILGPEYRFSTSFFLDADQVLYIRGGGDPVLTTESLTVAARELRQRGVVRVSAYVIDDSAFALEQSLPDGSENSSNPYDVANSALAVNFNSVAITREKDGAVTQGEELTPLTPLAMEIGRQLTPGRHRVNINAFPLRSATPLSLRYSAELLHALLLREGVASQAVIRQGAVPAGAKPVYTHVSQDSLREIVRSCLHVSNNFMANQLALATGAAQFGYPATWTKARRALNHVAWKRLGISAKDLQVTEGSGLSRQTRATPIAMLKLLLAFEPYRDLLPVKHGAQIKSGTMKDVYCYAGYLDTNDGSVLFVLLLNQPDNTRKLLLSSLEKRFAPPPIVQPAITNKPNGRPAS